ncbi:MAG: zinc ribbon domain-containing protein [Eubacteriales bacterium]|nr:zinc ribbon domain-containing protein [Bacillota bacterium]MBV1727432.1 zinc ribbon domain-containing protein [Desulforudis sp.]MDP3051328.1 zinc ribbon domain-containing protein [Eubacteriales bacterium]MDQ7788791.1 zinc ribbon domain-containing protein [Clostridia bacterium]MBU4532906.1 zinc ribbon domain-containing protein [Bacillota bacterium]
MPIYDFKCYSCGHRFTVLRSVSEKDNASCPKCKGTEVKQVVSPFSFGGPKKERGGGCGSGGSSGGG